MKTTRILAISILAVVVVGLPAGVEAKGGTDLGYDDEAYCLIDCYTDSCGRFWVRYWDWDNLCLRCDCLEDWAAADRRAVYGIAGNNGDGEVSVSSNFYLLVKYAEVTPKQFVCKGESDAREFKLGEMSQPATPGFELIDGWDFGPFRDSLLLQDSSEKSGGSAGRGR